MVWYARMKREPFLLRLCDWYIRSILQVATQQPVVGGAAWSYSESHWSPRGAHAYLKLGVETSKSTPRFTRAWPLFKYDPARLFLVSFMSTSTLTPPQLQVFDISFNRCAIFFVTRFKLQSRSSRIQTKSYVSRPQLFSTVKLYLHNIVYSKYKLYCQTKSVSMIAIEVDLGRLWSDVDRSSDELCECFVLPFLLPDFNWLIFFIEVLLS